MIKYYENITTCRSCGHTGFKDLQKSPEMPIAGIYYDIAAVNVKAPIHLIQCDECGLIQLREAIKPSIYKDYSFVGNSSVGYQSHLDSVAELLMDKYELRDKSVFEIGASNGVLLEILAKKGDNHVSGVEPSDKLCEDAAKRGVKLESEFFGTDYVSRSDIPQQDCVIIRHVLEHIYNLNDVLRAVDSILKPEGVLLIEVPDFALTVKNRIYSNIFHEHQNYFTRPPMDYLLANHGFSPVETKEADIHGGAFLTVYQRRETAIQSESDTDIALEDIQQFVRDSKHYYDRLNHMIHSYTEHRKIVHGYGGSHRTFILLGNAELKGDDIPIIYDGNPFLHGRKLNGFHSEIISPTEISNEKPDAIVIFATSYHDEIVRDLREKYDYQGEILSAQAEELIDK